MSSTKQPSREWPLYEGTTHQQLDAVKNCFKQHLSPKGYEYAMEYLTTGTDGTATRNGLCVKLCELIEPGFKAMIEFNEYKERRLTSQTYFTTSEMRQLTFDFRRLLNSGDLVLVPNSRGVRVLVHKELPKSVPKSALDITSLSFGRLVQQGVTGPVQLHLPQVNAKTLRFGAAYGMTSKQFAALLMPDANTYDNFAQPMGYTPGPHAAWNKVLPTFGKQMQGYAKGIVNVMTQAPTDVITELTSSYMILDDRLVATMSMTKEQLDESYKRSVDELTYDVNSTQINYDGILDLHRGQIAVTLLTEYWTHAAMLLKVRHPMLVQLAFIAHGIHIALEADYIKALEKAKAYRSMDLYSVKTREWKTTLDNRVVSLNEEFHTSTSTLPCTAEYRASLAQELERAYGVGFNSMQSLVDHLAQKHCAELINSPVASAEFLLARHAIRYMDTATAPVNIMPGLPPALAGSIQHTASSQQSLHAALIKHIEGIKS